jgi:hypothetical protein
VRRVQKNAITTARQPETRNPLKKKEKKFRVRDIREALENCVDPSVCAWFSLAKDPFLSSSSAELAAKIKMPLYVDNWACPSVRHSGFGSASLTGATSYTLWFAPDGLTNGVDDEHFPLCTMVDAASHLVGVTLGKSAVLQGTAGGYVTGLSTTTTPTVAAVSPLFFDLTTTPWVQPTGSQKSSFLEGRCISFGVRFTFNSPILDTAGYVEKIDCYEQDGMSADLFRADRTDPSYERRYFRDGTASFCHTIQCNSPVWKRLPQQSSAQDTVVRFPFMFQVHGLVAADEIQVEYISHMEYTATTNTQVLTPSTTTAQSIHVQNAVSLASGQPKAIEAAMVQSFVRHEPGLAKKVVNGVRLASDAYRGFKFVVTELGTIAEEVGAALSYL